MTDRDKVIKGLEHCSEDGCKDCPYETDCMMADGFSELAKDALELLKEQEPVKAEKEYSKGNLSWWHVCGSCHAPINPNDKYCNECGRRVKWDAVD